MPALQVFGFRSGNGDGLLTRRVRARIAGQSEVAKCKALGDHNKQRGAAHLGSTFGCSQRCKIKRQCLRGGAENMAAATQKKAKYRSRKGSPPAAAVMAGSNLEAKRSNPP